MAVRVHPGRKPATEALRCRVERLACLPIRPLTARQVMASVPEQPADETGLPLDWSKTRQARELDPGWVLGEHIVRGADQPHQAGRRTALVAARNLRRCRGRGSSAPLAAFRRRQYRRPLAGPRGR